VDGLMDELVNENNEVGGLVDVLVGGCEDEVGSLVYGLVGGCDDLISSFVGGSFLFLFFSNNLFFCLNKPTLTIPSSIHANHT
jgi:hypothetical protein